MIILAITLTAWAILRKHAHNKPSRAAFERTANSQTYLQTVSPAEIKRQEREREKARKAQQARELAQMELDHIEAQRVQLMYLYDALETERDADGTTQARKNTLTRQLIVLEDKLYKLDTRRAKAYSAAYAA